MIYPVAERFVSINGEGRKAGELAVFIRFRKCNLSCSYCDTKWANTEDCPAEMLSAEQIAGYVYGTGVKNVTLTGGEPLLQENLDELIDILMEQGNSVEIETNGSISIAELSRRENRPSFTLDYKLPDSNMERAMDLGNYNYIRQNDTVKFVAGSISDLETAVKIIEKYELLKKCSVYISPVFNRINPADIVDFMKKNNLNGVKLQLQLHKFIWNPEERGV
ncbi:MAG: putative 7-carboxy-7-deazaguanine synthase QueE [Ruminococcus sp.]|nr:putative 7-carboxy-7-deazaguanine synthase QueE [Ruminococcus sp.]MBR6581921.1 putative 7-carboxy-7-deazaguanine synthase QueE [Ruminococcus sp.]